MTGPVELSREEARIAADALSACLDGADDIGPTDAEYQEWDAVLEKLRALASGDLSPSLPASSEWRWRGMPGHLIVSASCCFHMVTEAHGFRVSTIDRVERGEKR